MLTFKRLIHREGKSSLNPMNLRDLLFWSVRGQALCGGNTAPNSQEGHRQKLSPGVGKRNFIQNYKMNIHKPRHYAITWISFTNKINVNYSCWFVPHLHNQTTLMSFSFYFSSVSTAMFFGLNRAAGSQHQIWAQRKGRPYNLLPLFGTSN